MQSIKNLSNDIRALLSDFTTRKIDKNEAASQLKILQDKYESLSTKNDVSGNDFFKSICYYHSISNFSTFTGIFSLRNGRIIPVSFSGSPETANEISSIIENNTDLETNEDKILSFDNYSLYIHFIDINQTKYYFCAKSNSKYFSTDVFTKYSTSYATTIPKLDAEIDVSLNLKTVKDYILFNTDAENAALCYIFTFPDLIQIFNHMGYRFIFSLSKKIIKILENDFEEAYIQPISINCYYVIITCDKKEKSLEQIKVPKVIFHFREIPIPYNSKGVLLQDVNDFPKLIDETAKLSCN